ncbi:hypothetical protein BVH03_25305 [Pseudomonas sp. PA15(2017)]|uniref:DUF637 domain-containing protein n=1 Tax=Pseudomonas sp. PA15(2017) TaxID=1932111 RepID=UPI000961200B|nr:DUF637 domain-containing protein [Pseudomonas sp. PA15(2017)]OLU22203.1 hypothetical protein BVH03_25305 [Pseudomonas sp. PA15(2017)]
MPKLSSRPEWRSTSATRTAPSTTSNAVGANSGTLVNSGAVITTEGLSTVTGVGQFAANQALQHGSSTLLNKALGRDGSLDEVLQATLANTFAAAGFNLIGKVSRDHQLENGGVPKVGLHAVMGGLAAKAAGADFKTGALAAGANEALISSLAKQYGSMSVDQQKRLLVMNSQLIGIVAAAALNEDEKGLQTGAWVAGNGTKYNHFSLPPGLIQYGQAATSRAQQMAENGESPDAVAEALRAMARGDGFEGPDPAKALLQAWATTVLTGGGLISTGTKLGTAAVGATIGGGANISYQLSTDLDSLSYTDATVAAIVGALSQGRGLVGTQAVSIGGAYVGSQIKGTDPVGAMVGAGVGAAAGAATGKFVKDSLPNSISNSLKETLGAVAGSAISEGAGSFFVEGISDEQ